MCSKEVYDENFVSVPNLSQRISDLAAAFLQC